jgi:hypothetical protein
MDIPNALLYGGAKRMGVDGDHRQADEASGQRSDTGVPSGVGFLTASLDADTSDDGQRCTVAPSTLKRGRENSRQLNQRIVPRRGRTQDAGGPTRL